MANLEIGTVISGTMRPEDLMPALFEALVYFDEGRAEGWAHYWRDIHFAMCACEGDSDDMFASLDPEKVGYALNDLFDELDKISPEGCYFGSHPGDGSDYGWWPIESYYDDEEEF